VAGLLARRPPGLPTERHPASRAPGLAGLRPARLLPAALALGALFSLGAAGVFDALADLEMEKAQGHLAAGQIAAGLSAAGRAERLCPWQAGPPLLQAETLLRHPEIAGGGGRAREAALRAAERAVALSPARGMARRMAGLASLAAGDRGGAAASLWQGARLNPMGGSEEDFEALQRSLERAVASPGGQP
jgi:hypothetical protein